MFVHKTFRSHSLLSLKADKELFIQIPIENVTLLVEKKSHLKFSFSTAQ